MVKISGKFFSITGHLFCNNRKTVGDQKGNTVGGRLHSLRAKWSSIMKNSYWRTIVLAVVIIGGVVAFWFGLKAGLRTDYPLLTVASGSMRDTLEVGDLIVVQGALNASELRAAPKPEGEVIVFRSPRMNGELIVHRAVDKEFNDNDGLWYFATKGDANYGEDLWGDDPARGTWKNMISETRLIGKVVGKAPWLGYIPLYIRTREGIILIVVLFLIVILAEYIPVLFKKHPE